MRTTRTLVILGLITLAVVLAAILTRKEPTAISQSGELLFPQLMTHINDISAVRQLSASGAFTLTRGDGGWVVEEKSSYPASADRVRQFVLGLAQLKRLEPKTRNADLFAKLGLEDVNTEGAESAQVVVKNATGAVLAELIIGKRRPGKADPTLSELFVRVPDDPQAWLVEGKLPEHGNATDWLDKEILTLDHQRIHEVRVSHPEAKEEVIIRRADPAASDYQLVSKPGNTEVKSTYAINSIATTLANLTLDDVKRASEASFSDTAELTVELMTFDGLRVVMEATKVEEDAYAQFKASFDASLIKTDARIKNKTSRHSEEEKSEQSKEDKPAASSSSLNTPDIVKKEAEMLNARWEDWVYVVPQYRLDSINKKKTDLVEVVDETEAEKDKTESEKGEMEPAKKANQPSRTAPDPR